jgi:hypothetical protein
VARLVWRLIGELRTNVRLFAGVDMVVLVISANFYC